MLQNSANPISGVIGRTVTQIIIKSTGFFTVNLFGHGKTITALNNIPQFYNIPVSSFQYFNQ